MPESDDLQQKHRQNHAQNHRQNHQTKNLRYRPRAGDGTLPESTPVSEANWHGRSVLPQEEFVSDAGEAVDVRMPSTEPPAPNETKRNESTRGPDERRRPGP